MAASYIDPDLNPEAYDQAIIGGVPTLGIATVSGGKYSLAWDAKKGTAKTGASTVFTGKDLSECTLKLTFADGAQGLSQADQISQFVEQIVPILQTSATGKQAVDFFHPSVSLEPINLTSVVVKTIGQIEMQDNGLKSVSIELIQYVKPKPARVGKPSGSASKTPAGSTAQDAMDREIEQLTEEVKELW
ncbi:MAG: hypothetical protein H6718_04095 [Polyangiaceae bacterium]|nr:hypothetical protein [Polyangiaceae bacterium]